MAPAVATYTNHAIRGRTVLYEVIAAYLETFLASLDADPDAKGLPVYVQREFYDYLQCGILAHGFLRLGCDTCQQELRLPCSCKRRGFCPSCAARRMAQTAAHLVEGVIPWVSTRQWVVSVLIPLRYWMAASQDLTAKVHTIIRTTIAQYDVNQAVKGGVERQQVQPGSVTCIQRFGSALNLNVPYHLIFLEGVYLDRTDQSRKPRFLKVEPPTDSDIADVVQKISRRVIRTLRRLGYLEAGIDDAMATGYDPLRDNEPELARTTAASVTQRITCGERTGQHVRRIGSGFGYEGEHPALTGTRCASVHGFSLHANTQVPAHRRDQLERLLRYTARGAVALERLAEAAHGDRVRVASRRLRSFLPLFALCLSRKTCDRWRKQLRRLTRALGEVRDIDVQIACVQHVLEQPASPEERPGLERLILRLQQPRHALHEPAGQAIERFTTSQLAEEMEQTLMHLVYVSQASGAEIPGPYVYRKIRKAVRARLKAFQTYAPYVQHPVCQTLDAAVENTENTATAAMEGTPLTSH